MQHGVVGGYQCGPYTFRVRDSPSHLWRSIVIRTWLSTLLHLYPNQLFVVEQSQVQQCGLELKKCLNVSWSAFPSEGTCWINRAIHRRSSRRSAIESSWVIRGTQFHFAAMLTDCHSRWRSGVTGESRNLTFPRRMRIRKRDCLHLKLGRSKVCKNKQGVSKFLLLLSVKPSNIILTFISFCFFTSSFIKMSQPVGKLVFCTSTTPNPMNYNVLVRQAYSNNKTGI